VGTYTVSRAQAVKLLVTVIDILNSWLYPPEILPLTIRAKGASLSTASNWFFNWIVGEVTPVLQELIGWRLYLMHAFFCAVSFVTVYFIYPETAK